MDFRVLYIVAAALARGAPMDCEVQLADGRLTSHSMAHWLNAFGSCAMTQWPVEHGCTAQPGRVPSDAANRPNET